MSYAVVAYQTAWFKCHHVREYMAALLTSVLDNTDKVTEYIAECKNCGIDLLPPDINRSDDRFTVEGNGIRFGLVAIKNIGRGFVQAIMRKRQEEGDFVSFQDFCTKMIDCTEMNRRAVENLIRAGAFDSLGARRSQLMEVYQRVLDAVASQRKSNVDGQLDFFGIGKDADGRYYIKQPSKEVLEEMDYTAGKRVYFSDMTAKALKQYNTEHVDEATGITYFHVKKSHTIMLNTLTDEQLAYLGVSESGDVMTVSAEPHVYAEGEEVPEGVNDTEVITDKVVFRYYVAELEDYYDVNSRHFSVDLLN